MRPKPSPILAAALAGGLCGQVPEGGPSDLEKLLATPVAVATAHPVPLRESPGVITLLTREDIQGSGAQTLMELLRRVPGLDFASDTNTVLGLGVHTAWAHDGKVLLIIDGQEMNEPLYGTTQFGGHYPLAQVDRIEIIRGPGSAIYGGYAGLAVIRVTTRAGAQVAGTEGQLWLGRMAGSAQTRLQAQATFGQAWGDHELSVTAARSMAPQGVGTYPVSQGLREAGDEGRTAETHVNLGYAWDTLRFRYLHDAFSARDYTRFTREPTWMVFPSDHLGLEWSASAGDWTLQPRFSFKHQRPWMYSDARTDRNTRGVASLLASWAPSSTFRLTLGGEATQDESNIYWSARDVREVFVFQSRAALLQTLWSPEFGNLDFGVRYDRSNAYGSATSPRLAFTRAADGWHFKVLAAGAFRAPSFENLLVNPALRPERTVTYEVEAGWALSRESYLTANLFSLRVKEPISYGSTPAGDGTYLNFDHTGAEGVDVQLKTQGERLAFDGSVSYARARDHKADFYRVASTDTAHVGFAALKVAGQARWRFAPDWSLNPGLILHGPRYGYRYGQTATSRFGGTVLLDLGCTWAPSERLQAGLFLANALNREVPWVQAYGLPGTGGNPPLPGPGREVSLRLTFKP